MLTEFLYPKFINPSHKIKENAIVSKDYPTSRAFNNRKDFILPPSSAVCVVRDNLGFNNNWALVKFIDNVYASEIFYNQSFYVSYDSLEAINNKKKFLPIVNSLNSPNLSEREIDVNLKEIFLPYVDKRNGLYSVRIQTDYQKVIDSVLFDNLVEEVFFEGISLLLASKGYRSDNATIEKLRDEYNTFGFVNNDLDITVTRQCEPLTFTVSIPLSFFNTIPNLEQKQADFVFSPQKIIKFTNKNLIQLMNKLSNIFSSRAGDILQLINPDKFIEGFILDYELISFKNFIVSLRDILDSTEFAFNNTAAVTYEIGLDNDLNLVSFTAIRDNSKVVFNKSLFTRLKLANEFNSKRIFNYLINISSMQNDVLVDEINVFLNKYVNYPKPSVKEAQLLVNNKPIDAKTAKAFKISYSEAKESCVSIRDLSEASADLNSIYSDTIYNIFVATEKEVKQESLINKLPSQLEKIDEEVRKTIGEQDFSVSSILKNNLEQAKKDAKININTFLYLAERINLTSILFKNIFCLLKGADPSDVETVKLIQEISPDIINYFNYLYSVRELKGKEFVKSLAKGVPLDRKLFCSNNSDITYFLKALSAISKTLNVIGVSTIEAKNALAQSKPIENPWQPIVKAIISGAQEIAIRTTFAFIQDALTLSCDDDLYNPAQTQNPFETHSPIEQFNAATNNNKGELNKNKNNALDKVYQQELRFGFDKEYVVELISQLINDVNCILTPLESVNLLRGEPTPLVETLIINIIKSKYSQSPSDLSFLLTNKAKLKLFFKELGLTVDADVLENIERQTSNITIPSQVCSPEQLIARETILRNKIPKELGILERQNARRTKKARELLETIKSGATQVNISALCPENTNADLERAKDYLFANYDNFLNNLFKDVLRSFNSEAKALPEAFSETKYIYRLENGNLFDGVEYTNYYSNLDNNLSLSESIIKVTTEGDRKQNPIINFREVNKAAGEIIYDHNYVRELPKGLESVKAPEYPTPQGQEIAIVCGTPPPPSTDSEFVKFLSNGQAGIFFEDPVFDEYFDDTSDIDIRNAFDDEDDLDKEIRNLQYVYSITISEGDYINFKLWNIKRKKVIKVGDTVTINPKSIENYKSLETDLIKSLARMAERNLARTYEVSSVYRPIINNRQDAINFASGLDNFAERTINLIAKFFEDKFADKVSFVEQKPTGIGSFNGDIFSDTRLFKVETKINYKTGKLEKTAFINIITGSSAENYKPDLVFYVSASVPNTIYNAQLLNDVNLKNEWEPERYWEQLNESLNNPPITNAESDAAGNRTANVGGGEVPAEGYLGVLVKNFYDFIRVESEKKYFKTSYAVPDDFTVAYIASNGISYTGSYDYETEEYVFEDSPGINRDTISDTSFESLLPDRNIKIEESKEKVSAQKDYISRYSLYEYPKDERFYSCNVNPHYLNLDFFKLKALNGTRSDLCDDNLDKAFENSLNEILINLIYRTFVTDLLIKCMPIWPLLTKQQIETVEKEGFLLEVLSKLFIREIQMFSPNYSLDSTGESIAEKHLFSLTRQVYDYLKDKDQLVESFISTPSEKELAKDFYKIEYFIKKEIRHFFKYSINKKIFIPRESNLVDDFFANKDTDGDRSLIVPSDKADDFRTVQASQINFVYKSLPSIASYLQDELYGMIFFFVIANTVEGLKRSIFFSTKSSLMTILLRQTTQQFPEDSEAITNYIPSSEEVIKFINDLSTSPNPAIMVLLKPQFSKYIKDYILGALEFSRSTILNIAQQNDLNIRLTRLVNAGISTAGVLSWALIDQTTRNNLINNSNSVLSALTYSRLEAGKSILPDFATSLGVIWPTSGVAPTKLGVAYLALDTLFEAKWTLETLSKISQQKPGDPCQDVKDTTRQEPIKCTPEQNEKLKKELNAFEEP